MQEAYVVMNIVFSFSAVLQKSLNTENCSIGGYKLTATTLSFQPTSHACVIFSPLLDMLTPVLSIVALTALYLINSNKS